MPGAISWHSCTLSPMCGSLRGSKFLSPDGIPKWPALMVTGDSYKVTLSRQGWETHSCTHTGWRPTACRGLCGHCGAVTGAHPCTRAPSWGDGQDGPAGMQCCVFRVPRSAREMSAWSSFAASRRSQHEPCIVLPRGRNAGYEVREWWTCVLCWEIWVLF